MPVAASTAYNALLELGKIKRGDRVLINGASGSVGSFAIQIAKAWGATVTAVCSTSNLGPVRALGADEVLDDSYKVLTGRIDSLLRHCGDIKAKLEAAGASIQIK